MNDISIAIASSFYRAARHEPILFRLGDRLCRAYGIGYPRSHVFTNEPKDKMILFKAPLVIGQRIVKPICKLLRLPSDYAYIINVVLCDYLISRRIRKDKSRVLYTFSFMVRTIEQAKKAGKIVVVEAGNSEPLREHNRIVSEYDLFSIKHRYIYGRSWFMKSCQKGFELCDYIVTVSETSNNTYIEAGYPKEKLIMIPLTGTDFDLAGVQDCRGKQKAFVTTAFQNFIKGTHRLLLAWKKANIKDIPLIVVGKLCDDMREFIDKYGPFDNVQFMGYAPDLKAFYNQFDAVGIILSLSEGAVRVTPEMMSYGFPMITSPDATCDIVKNGVNGFIVEATDEDSIAERIQFFARDWDRVHELRKSVLDSVNYRTSKDWAIEVADYLMSKC